MVPHTRRHLLHVAAAVTAGMAGCGSLTGDTAQSSRSVSENGGSVPPGTTETDPPTVRLRANSERPPLRLSEPGQTETPLPDWREHRSSRLAHDVIDSQSQSQRLVVTDSVDSTDTDSDDADVVSSFVSATNFDEQTLYLETTLVEECFRLHLCHISWQSDEVRTDYVRELRPYDERCVADAQVAESRLIRLPVALDRDQVNSFGTSIGSGGGCDTPRVRAVASDGDSSSETSNRTTTGGGQ